MTPTEEREKVENEILLEWMPDRSDSQQYPDFNFWKTKEQVKGLFDALVDSRLELDRLRSENAELRKDAERGRLHKAAADKWVPCPDHRDKVSGGCYVCENESLRKRVEENKVWRDKMTATAEITLTEMIQRTDEILGTPNAVSEILKGYLDLFHIRKENPQ